MMRKNTESLYAAWFWCSFLCKQRTKAIASFMCRLSITSSLIISQHRIHIVQTWIPLLWGGYCFVGLTIYDSGIKGQSLNIFKNYISIIIVPLCWIDIFCHNFDFSYSIPIFWISYRLLPKWQTLFCCVLTPDVFEK